MSFSRTVSVNFGASRTGLSTVAWSLNAGATWSTTGVSEAPAGTGKYRATIEFPDEGAIVDWKTGEGSNERYADETIRPDSSDGSIDLTKELMPAAIVADSSPTRGGFTIAMADDSDVPTTFIWRNSEAWFDGVRDVAGGKFLLSGGKFLFATYTKLTAKTARLTFSPLLPVPPANGDTLRLA